ncbi:hypothetical protein H112_00720 [Trichophyton rubrum D6]|nr:hypothetical protein H104_00704 [Trichophyton rubrum CBS 289.86]KDB38069.1 hypothetical protein H112_00720 [Trichophyton rubrum D6]
MNPPQSTPSEWKMYDRSTKSKITEDEQSEIESGLCGSLLWKRPKGKNKGNEKGNDKRNHGDIGTPQGWEAGIQTKPMEYGSGSINANQRQRQRDEGKGELNKTPTSRKQEHQSTNATKQPSK